MHSAPAPWRGLPKPCRPDFFLEARNVCTHIVGHCKQTLRTLGNVKVVLWALVLPWPCEQLVLEWYDMNSRIRRLRKVTRPRLCGTTHGWTRPIHQPLFEPCHPPALFLSPPWRSWLLVAHPEPRVQKWFIAWCCPLNKTLTGDLLQHRKTVVTQRLFCQQHRQMSIAPQGYLNMESMRSMLLGWRPHTWDYQVKAFC